jgi:hypothetical protein
MSGTPKHTFRGITRAIFARLRRRALKVGIHVASTKGEAEKDGVKIRWQYDARAELLEVECKVPFWINANRINADVRQQIEAIIRAA